MRPTVYRRSSVVCLSVGRSVTTVSPVKTAEPIEIPFGYGPGWAQLKEPRIRWGPDPPLEGTTLRGKGRPIVKYRDYRPRAAAMWPFVRIL